MPPVDLDEHDNIGGHPHTKYTAMQHDGPLQGKQGGGPGRQHGGPGREGESPVAPAARHEALVVMGAVRDPDLLARGEAAKQLRRGIDAERGAHEAGIARTEQGYWGSQILGPHTQDAARGNFSLVVTQGLAIADGAFAGHAKALMVGNFFQALRDGLVLADIPGKDFPMIGLMADLSPA